MSTLETELARLCADNLTAHKMVCAAGLERDRLRAEVEAITDTSVKLLASLTAERAEVERWQAEAEEMSAQRSHNANQAGRLRAEVEQKRNLLVTAIKSAGEQAARAERAEAECLEQARLLGMSGEREAELLGKIERLNRINETILFFAFRYALGRRSTAPSIVADVLINRWNDLKPHTQIQVQREIGSAMAMGEAGSSCDLDTWQKVLALPVQQ